MSQPRFVYSPHVFKRVSASSLWFWLSMAGLLVASVLLRFWGLGRFNTLVFDEVYYAKFASAYLNGEAAFGGHPPLSTYLIAFSIWVANHTPIGDDPVRNSLTGLSLAPVSYRWLNAATGSLLPFVAAGIAYLLSHRRSYALIAGVLTVADGLFLVESRYALVNVYLVLFGLLGHLFLLLALGRSPWRWGWLLLSGLGFGAAAAVKWNGLGFLLGAYGIWGLAWAMQGAQGLRQRLARGKVRILPVNPLEKLTQLNLAHVLMFWGAVPAIAYYLSWIPYMQLDGGRSFWAWQDRIMEYHNQVGGPNAHPYCSAWYTWPLMLRPVAYFYKTAHGPGEPPPIVGPALPSGAGPVIYDVHAMGNPVLWWLSTAAMIVLVGFLLGRSGQWLKASLFGGEGAFSAGSLPTLNPIGFSDPGTLVGGNRLPSTGIALYLVVNWAANWLPWAKVTRCLFLYHYMGSAVFALLGIAWMCDRWLYSLQPWRRALAVTLIFLILLAFVFWLPLYLGLPLSASQIALRRWLSSWI